MLSGTTKRISGIGKKIMLSSVPANLIRQWCYCPRVVYYMELMDMPIHRPSWVKQGEEFHRLQEKLWQRRNLSRFKLASGKIHHNLTMRSEDLGLHGIVDMAIETEEAVYPVEFKLSPSNKKRGDILQLTAYAMLLEKYFGKSSPVGFLAGKGKFLHSIDIDSARQQEVTAVVGAIIEMLQRGTKPETSATVVQCCACEYVNFCNDRL